MAGSGLSGWRAGRAERQLGGPGCVGREPRLIAWPQYEHLPVCRKVMCTGLEPRHIASAWSHGTLRGNSNYFAVAHHQHCHHLVIWPTNASASTRHLGNTSLAISSPFGQHESGHHLAIWPTRAGSSSRHLAITSIASSCNLGSHIFGHQLTIWLS